MFDFEELFRGYSASDEYIARDMMILSLLMKKGIITSQDVKNTFTSDNLTKYIEVVQEEKKRRAEDILKEKESEG